MLSPIQAAEETIKKCNAKIDLANALMVQSIRASVYREKAKSGYMDGAAFQWLHNTPTYFGTQTHIDSLREEIVTQLEIKVGAESFRNQFLDAMHESSHEVLGECMYQTDEIFNPETGYYDPILTQPCEIWYPGGKDTRPKKTYEEIEKAKYDHAHFYSMYF